MGKQFIGKFSALAAGIGALALLGAVAPVKAGVINIGSGVGSTDATGLNNPGDPQLIGNTGDVSIYFNGSGSVTSDVLLALLVPNDSTDSFGATNPLGTITSYANYALYPSGPVPVPGSSAFVSTGFSLGTGSASYQSNGFWGEFPSPLRGPGPISAFLGTSFSSSDSFTNFAYFDSHLNSPIAASDYGVYTFDVKPGQSLSGGGIINIAIPGYLPTGSILLAYSDAGDSTVWTNDGGVNGGPGTIPAGGPLPIPATLPLTAAGGLGLLVLALRKRKTQV